AMWLLYPFAVGWVAYTAPSAPERDLRVRQWFVLTFLAVPSLFMLFIGWPLFYTGWESLLSSHPVRSGEVFFSELISSRFGTALMGGFFFFSSALVGYLLLWPFPRILIVRPISHPLK